MQIAQIEPIAVIFTAPEAELSGILKAESQGPLKVRTLSSNGKEPLAEGELILVNNQVDSATGTVRLKAQSPLRIIASAGLSDEIRACSCVR